MDTIFWFCCVVVGIACGIVIAPFAVVFVALVCVIPVAVAVLVVAWLMDKAEEWL